MQHGAVTVDEVAEGIAALRDHDGTSGSVDGWRTPQRPQSLRDATGCGTRGRGADARKEHANGEAMRVRQRTRPRCGKDLGLAEEERERERDGARSPARRSGDARRRTDASHANTGQKDKNHRTCGVSQPNIAKKAPNTVFFHTRKRPKKSTYLARLPLFPFSRVLRADFSLTICPISSSARFWSVFSLKRSAFQTIRPVVSRKNAVFPLTLGRAALCCRLAFHLFQR